MNLDLSTSKIKRKTKTPTVKQSLLSKNTSDCLNYCIASTKEITPMVSQSKKRPATANQINFQPKRIHFKKKPVEKPLDYDPTSINLIVMEQYRRGLMKEIEKFPRKITPALLEKVRNSSVQKEFLNLNQLHESIQREKLKKELLSRSPFKNAIYMLRAMSRSSRNSVVKELCSSIPEGTRFIRCARFTS